jgi:hypothetical protein
MKCTFKRSGSLAIDGPSSLPSLLSISSSSPSSRNIRITMNNACTIPGDAERASPKLGAVIHLCIGVQHAGAAVAANRVVGEGRWHVVDLLERRVQAAQRHHAPGGLQLRGRPHIPRKPHPITLLGSMEIPLHFEE